jgi:hypothetical protein
MNDKRLSNCILYPAGLYGARSVIFTYTKTILVWFYTPSMNHGKRSAKDENDANPINCALTQQEKDFLWKQMAQIFTNDIEPLMEFKR